MLTWSGAAILALLVFGYRLNALVPSLSPQEKSTWNAAGDWHALLADPTNAPYKALLWAAHFLPFDSSLSARLPSAAILLIALVLFVSILHRWHGPRSTVFGFFLFLTSAWLLHVGRFAGPDIMYIVSILALIAVHIGLYDHGDSPLMLYAWLLTNIAVLFVPGMAWFVLFGIALQAGALWSAVRDFKALWQKLLWPVIAFGGLGAIAAAVAYHLALWRTWLGLPEQFAAWQPMLTNIGRVLLAVVYRAPLRPGLWLGQLPILGVFLSLMLLAGVVFYARHFRAARSHLLAGYVVISVVLAALGGAVTLSVLVPTLYLIVVAGIAYVLHFWLRMFPRNQLARGAGIAVVSLAVALACAYNLQQYFVAWPHNPDTAASYHYKLKF